MSSIQFNYFANKEGEKIIREQLLKFGSIYIRDSFREKEKYIKNVNDFDIFSNKIYLTSNELEKKIEEDKDNYIDIFNSPVIEYIPSKIRDENIYVSGRFAYFSGDKFPDFKKDVQNLFRKFKTYCWKDKQWQSWVFDTIGNEATVLISNKVVHLKKE